MLTKAKYRTLRAAYDLHDAERKRLYGNKSIGAAESNTLPYSPTNDERGQMEVYEFVTDIPKKYFAYVHCEGERPIAITTWPGDNLGMIIGRGLPYYSNMGDKRVNIRVKAINGREYTGIYFQSAGDYCRLKICK